MLHRFFCRNKNGTKELRRNTCDLVLPKKVSIDCYGNIELSKIKCGINPSTQKAVGFVQNLSTSCSCELVQGYSLGLNLY